tara:strand:- start:499 stop:1482 length:984 start_codon:yes stop_codon:yes gene_type:complete
MTAQQKNFNRRVIDCRGPHFRIDSGHPQIGATGSEVFKIYATNDNDDVFLIDHTQGGLSRITADKTLEIRAGDKNSPQKIDIRISAASGNITVNADNGSVNVAAKNIMVKAAQDLDLNGGRNVNITAGSGRVHLKGNTCSASGKRGNLIHKTFGLNMFASSYVPNNILQAAFGADASISTLTKGAGAFSSALSGGFGGAIADSVLSETGLGGALGGQLSEELGGLFSSATDSLGGLEGKLGGLTDKLSGQLPGITDKLGGLTDKLGGELPGLTGKLGDVANLSKGQLSNLTNKLGNFDSSKISGAIEGGLGNVSGSIDKLTDKLGEL